ncbi:putative mitochondrial protein AtMg01250 [Bidens hawaiensis]|uniref:putative mitochondrial protein AtMg01250 n=1 Tax=Bidens hawaiensis TaxID=980011 RepID=UPI004049D91A
MVMCKVTSQIQFAFLNGRFILDVPLVLNEILSWDMKMVFPSNWCRWVRGIICSARTSILINGYPTFEFGYKKYEKGIRQGDPSSPFLFLFVMEALSGLFWKVACTGAFDKIRFPNGELVINHLLFADDAMLLG